MTRLWSRENVRRDSLAMRRGFLLLCDLGEIAEQID